MKRMRARQAAAVAVGFAAFAIAQSRMAGAEGELSQRIGPTQPTAVALEAIPAGRSLATVKVGFPEVPIRWRQPGAAADPSMLSGLVAAVDLPAGTMLGPGAAVRQAPGPSPVRSDTRRESGEAGAGALPSAG